MEGVPYATLAMALSMFMQGYGNTVVTSQHISQSYFIKEIEFGQCESSTHLSSGSHNFQSLPNSLSLPYIYIHQHYHHTRTHDTHSIVRFARVSKH